jgi:hypothetical protein
MLRPTVEPAPPPPIGSNIETEFCGNYYLFAMRDECLTYEFFVGEWPVEFFELLGGGKKDGGWDGSGMSPARLAILPGVTHYTIFSSPLLVSITTLFMDTASQGK